MASSFSSALMASSSHSAMYTGEWEYDVFLCFRGDDTRHGFASHLMAALSDKQIKAFIDTMLRKTECIDELLSILQRSALSIVIFSENFADSPWCLDEVATIAQSMVKFGHRVLPVFYRVGWSDVAGDSGSYSITIDYKLKASSEDNKRWRDALKAVANCAGHTSQAIQIEAKLAKEIVEDVQKQLIDMSPSIKSNNLVGMGSRVLEIQRLLAMNSLDDTQIIGIWGMGGVGKTTLAKACYERLTSLMRKTKHRFVRNINENCEKHHGVEEIVSELYSRLLSESNISHVDLDISYRRALLSRLKVFIVLDDVETPLQLEQLLLGDVFNLPKLFAAGSRIIVTTRNKKVLQNALAKIYNVACLNDIESTQLFSLHAFKQHCPLVNWTEMSRLAISYCKGNPLALRVLGGTLFGEDKHYWQSFLSGLRRIQKPEIHDILRRSYNKLTVEEKKLFLDVACLLNGISRSRLIEYMDTVCPAAYAKVKDLIDKSLFMCISKKDGENIEVHGLLKEMAWNIVNEEPKLGKRSRLVDPEDIHKLLTTQKVKNWTKFVSNFFKGIEEMVLPRRKRRKVIDLLRTGNNALEGDRTTEGLSLDLSKANKMHLEANAFEGMDSLTFMKFWWPRDFEIEQKIHLPHSGLDSLPDRLRWLHWDAYPSKSLPWRFYPQHLVNLIIRHSPIKRCWEGFDQPMLVNLVVLDLSSCKNLTVVPNLSMSSSLEELRLQGCFSLVELPSHVQYLHKLITVDLRHCVNLERLPSRLDSNFLKHVWIQNCPKVMQCPEINSGELEELDLDGTPIRELPGAIYNVKQGGVLRLCGESITDFPAISRSLKEFRLCHTAIRDIYFNFPHLASSELLPIYDRLELVENCRLESLPRNLWNMAGQLVVEGSLLIESLPEISEPGCRSHKNGSDIHNMSSLNYLCLKKMGIKSLPSCVHKLDRLNSIELWYCERLESIPTNIHKLSQLLVLTLRGCRSIRSLPELPLRLLTLDVGGCKSLQALPSNIAKLSWGSVRFDDCPQLNETMVNFPVHVTLSRQSKVSLLYSGSEIPKWFAYKSVNDKDDSCVTVELSPSTCSSEQLMMKGITFGIVCSWDHWDGQVNMRCDCNINTTTIASWSSDRWFLDGDDTPSDKVFLWFDKNSSGKTKKRRGGEEGESWYMKYAGLTVSFWFYLQLPNAQDVNQLKNFKIKRCGVSLLY
ncbi:unnamed protein product [Linum trigynum]|uniref:TIR domain-containing protein n=1 Tax=Linum trigynum TaxID=586398 RepID=A0AAV2D2J9_9ROSI